MSEPSRFLERWSRLKREAETPAPPAGEAPAVAASSAPDGSVVIPADAAGERLDPGPADALPPLETLDLDADFTGFLKKEVGEPLRRAALRKLFSDPHFNRMDGLDVYIDDYNVADPIPPDVMKRLRQFQTFLSDEQEQAPVNASSADPAPALESLPADGDDADAGATQADGHDVGDTGESGESGGPGEPGAHR